MVLFFFSLLHKKVKVVLLAFFVIVVPSPVTSDSLWPHRLQHARSLCPSPSLEVCPSSCPLYWWCQPAILSSDTLYSFCPQSFPASGTFPNSQLFTSDDQNTGVSAAASVLPKSIQGWPSLLDPNSFSLFSPFN